MKNKSVLMAVLTVLMTVSAQAKEVKIAVGLSLPPYFIESQNSGIEFEIIQEALKEAGHTLKTTYVPLARVPVLVQSGEADGAATVSESSGIKGHYSDPHIKYQNFAISLEKSNLAISSIADLGKLSVAAFQNAKLYLGDEFKGMTDKNKDYQELANQAIQNKLLYSGRIQVVVGDRNIFKFYNKEVKEVDTTAPVKYSEIFPATEYKMLFSNEALKNEFNAGLKKIKSNGKYESILKKYNSL